MVAPVDPCKSILIERLLQAIPHRQFDASLYVFRVWLEIK